MKVTDIKVYAVEAVRRNWTFIEVETDAELFSDSLVAGAQARSA